MNLFWDIRLEFEFDTELETIEDWMDGSSSTNRDPVVNRTVGTWLLKFSWDIVELYCYCLPSECLYLIKNFQNSSKLENWLLNPLFAVAVADTTLCRHNAITRGCTTALHCSRFTRVTICFNFFESVECYSIRGYRLYLLLIWPSICFKITYIW